MLTTAKIKALCKQRGITVAELERSVGLGNGTIGKWNGKSPGINQVKAVADFFNVGIDDVFSSDQSANG